MGGVLACGSGGMGSDVSVLHLWPGVAMERGGAARSSLGQCHSLRRAVEHPESAFCGTPICSQEAAKPHVGATPQVNTHAC